MKRDRVKKKIVAQGEYEIHEQIDECSWSQRFSVRSVSFVYWIQYKQNKTTGHIGGYMEFLIFLRMCVLRFLVECTETDIESHVVCDFCSNEKWFLVLCSAWNNILGEPFVIDEHLVHTIWCINIDLTIWIVVEKIRLAECVFLNDERRHENIDKWFSGVHDVCYCCAAGSANVFHTCHFDGIIFAIHFKSIKSYSRMWLMLQLCGCSRCSCTNSCLKRK